jgi:hypothetical protein
MKKLLLLLSCATSFSYFAQSGSINSFINLDVPDKRVMPNMSNAYGVGMELLIPVVKEKPFYLNLSYTGAYYAYKTVSATYYFTDGTETKTDVNYSSAINKFLIGGTYRQNLGARFPVDLYATAQCGMMVINNRIYIEDPKDAGGCKALENKNVFNRKGFLYSAGGGFQINTEIFGNESKHGAQLIDVGCFFTGGPRMEYVNINQMKDESQGTSSHSGNPSGNSVRDYYASFVNVSTNSIHEHKIAEVYTTPLRFWTFRIGYVFQL